MCFGIYCHYNFSKKIARERNLFVCKSNATKCALESFRGKLLAFLPEWKDNRRDVKKGLTEEI